MENIPQIIEIALLLLIFFLLGCIIGWLLRAKIFRASNVSSSMPVDEEAQKLSLARADIQVQAPGRPKTLSAPRTGGKDDLKLIRGVGPKIEQKLNELGIYHFDQIAAWDSDASDWVDDYLSFKGRIRRDNWVAQAKDLT